MATTLSDIRTRIAYRLGEASAPGDSNEQARRDSYINEAQRIILGDKYWWFLQTTGYDATVSGLEIYTLASDFRDIIEVRVDGKISVPIPQSEAFGTYNYPPLYYQYRSVVQKHFVFGDTELHLIPIPSSATSSISISSITQSAGIATVTTASAHGYSQGKYVTISGSDQSDYNSTFRVRTVPTTTTFTVEVDSGATSPATGTMSVIEKNIVYRYWKKATDLSATTDTTVIPDTYADSIVYYALGLKYEREGLDGSADSAFTRSAQIVKDMIKENNRRKFYNKGVGPVYPDEVVY